ncbi:hypothetical protein [Streptomyces lydicus]|uniref:hypothetical protein n=1 Tax=Streptomyces lydicus TaxID=47763 RepID=UPI000F8C8F0C|nr:hypothetical protein [Streptomyces lydicus]
MVDEVDEPRLRDWHRPFDLLPGASGKSGQSSTPPDPHTLTETLDRIMLDTGPTYLLAER